jgi:hypothetical protein
MSTMLERLYGSAFLGFLFVIVVLSGEPGGAQTTTGEPAPQGMTTCDFAAESGDASEQGLAVRAAPDATAQVLGYIATNGDKQENSAEGTTQGHGFRVLGAMNGWLQIEGAIYANPESPPSLDEKGWVDGRSVTVRLYRETLKAAPNDNAPDVVYLVGYDADGNSLYFPETVSVSRVFGCSGRWFEVEIRLLGAKTLTGEAASSANGTVRGWTDRTCAELDVFGKCVRRQFDYPWSPLPTGITECKFSAFSKDRDPAGLNVRADPDGNARILGRLPTSNDPEIFPQTYSTFGADVIGYKKGWFLIEHGFEAVWSAKRPKEPLYTGRGWVAANLMTTQLLREKLKLTPDGASPDALDLKDIKGEGPDDCCFLTPRRILGCSGDWVHVEIGLHPGEKALAKTNAPAGAVSGWADGTCASQTTPCEPGQGSPLPTSPRRRYRRSDDPAVNEAAHRRDSIPIPSSFCRLAASSFATSTKGQNGLDW